MDDGCTWGDATGHSNPHAGWDSDAIVAGTKIAMMVDFNQNGTATITAYKDGVRTGVLSTGSLRGPLCPAVSFYQIGQSVEIVSSDPPHT